MLPENSTVPHIGYSVGYCYKYYNFVFKYMHAQTCITVTCFTCVKTNCDHAHVLVPDNFLMKLTLESRIVFNTDKFVYFDPQIFVLNIEEKFFQESYV